MVAAAPVADRFSLAVWVAVGLVVRAFLRAGPSSSCVSVVSMTVFALVVRALFGAGASCSAALRFVPVNPTKLTLDRWTISGIQGWLGTYGGSGTGGRLFSFLGLLGLGSGRLGRFRRGGSRLSRCLGLFNSARHGLGNAQMGWSLGGHLLGGINGRSSLGRHF